MQHSQVSLLGTWLNSLFASIATSWANNTFGSLLVLEVCSLLAEAFNFHTEVLLWSVCLMGAVLATSRSFRLPYLCALNEAVSLSKVSEPHCH